MKLHSIQVLRAVAAMLVVLHHVVAFPIGAAGVDIFFVVSGFIIASVGPGDSPGRFLAKRAARIYPLYWLCQSPYFLHAAVTSQLSSKLVWTSLTLVSLGGVSRPVLGVGWTLIFEIFFYLAAAASIAIRDYKPILAAFLLLFLLNNIEPNAVFGFLGHPLMLEFLAGALIVRLPRSRRFALAGVAVAAVIIALAWNHDLPWGWVYEQSAHELYRFFYWGLPAMLIVYAAVAFEHFFAGIRWTPFVVLGDASYALYLTFTLILSLGLWWPLTLLVSLAVALGVHFWIERPLVAAVGARWVADRNSPNAQSVPGPITA